jgi:hypothetical protein
VLWVTARGPNATQLAAGKAGHTIHIIFARRAKRPSVSRIHRIFETYRNFDSHYSPSVVIHCPCIEQYRFNDPFQAIRDSDDLVHRD